VKEYAAMLQNCKQADKQRQNITSLAEANILNSFTVIILCHTIHVCPTCKRYILWQTH